MGCPKSAPTNWGQLDVWLGLRMSQCVKEAESKNLRISNFATLKALNHLGGCNRYNKQCNLINKGFICVSIAKNFKKVQNLYESSLSIFKENLVVIKSASNSMPFGMLSG